MPASTATGHGSMLAFSSRTKSYLMNTETLGFRSCNTFIDVGCETGFVISDWAGFVPTSILQSSHRSSRLEIIVVSTGTYSYRGASPANEQIKRSKSDQKEFLSKSRTHLLFVKRLSFNFCLFNFLVAEVEVDLSPHNTPNDLISPTSLQTSYPSETKICNPNRNERKVSILRKRRKHDHDEDLRSSTSSAIPCMLSTSIDYNNNNISRSLCIDDI